MERLAYKKLLGWKNNKNRKPLILNGARQVGKTWLLKDFGEKEYESVAYINCDETKDLKAVFSDFNTDMDDLMILLYRSFLLSSLILYLVIKDLIQISSI